MSSLIVEVCKVDSIEPHPNADRLCIAKIKGWQVVVGYNPETKTPWVNPGDKVVYIPPDAILGPELAHGPDDNPPGRLNISKYCSPINGKYRVRAARLRQVASYGTIMTLNPEEDWALGTDVARQFNITKYEPPIVDAGDSAPESPLFPKYTDIENIGNFPDLMLEGEEVVITEKIHGTSCRMGLVREDIQLIFMAGSHKMRRQEGKSIYWQFFTDNVKSMLSDIIGTSNSLVIYGEIYGLGVQDLTYGLTYKAFRLFDMCRDGQYLDFEDKTALCTKYDIEMAPVLYVGPFSQNKVRELVDGPTTLCLETENRSKFKGREGIVITPTKERLSPIGRTILKAVSSDYLNRRGAVDNA